MERSNTTYWGSARGAMQTPEYAEEQSLISKNKTNDKKTQENTDITRFGICLRPRNRKREILFKSPIHITSKGTTPLNI